MRLVFTIPYTSYEILVFAKGERNTVITYDPLSTTPPKIWLAGCERCARGDRRVPLKVRRAVRCLATLKPTVNGGYTVKVCTGKKDTHSVKAQRSPRDWILTVRDLRDKPLPDLQVTGRAGTYTSTRGKPRDYRAPVLLRTLRMLLSAREASEQEVRAVLQGLAPGEPQRHAHDDEVSLLAGYQKISIRKHSPDRL
jgi:hypothetical protein